MAARQHPRGQGQWLVMMMMVVVFSSSILSSVSPMNLKTKMSRLRAGYCEKSNFRRHGPAPLNLTTPRPNPGFLYESETAYLHYCVRYFTHFRWYRIRNPKHWNLSLHDLMQHKDDLLDPFPWGQKKRVSHLPGRWDNQTVVIWRAKREDGGIYVFVASNGTHQVMGKVPLEVACRSRGAIISTAEQPVQYVNLGASKKLSCAVSLPDCSGRFYRTNVFWVWYNRQSGSQKMLRNFTLHSVSIVCDQPKYFGSKCEVLIHHVEEEMFQGEFVCQTDGSDNLQRTVRLVPLEIEVKTRPIYVILIVVAIVMLLPTTYVLWRYGHRIQFYCRRQPGRGHYKADGVILHGEDQEELVREHLLPQVRALGYDILEQVTTPGKPELTEQLQAVEDSHSVLLTFSSREMAHDGNLHFLTQYVFTRKTPSTVLFIRCQDHNDLNERGNNATGEEEEEEVGEGLISSTGRNPWKNEALKPFRVLKLPRSLHLGESGAQSPSFREQRNVEKFLCSVQKYLPKKTSPDPSAKLRTPGRAATHHNTSSSASHRPLISDSSAETNGVRVSDYGPSSPSTYATSPGVEARQTEDGRPVSSSSSSPSSQPEPVVVEGVAPSSTVSPGNREGQAARESSAQDLRSPAARVLIQTEPEASSTRVSSPQTSFTSQEELDKADQGHHHHHPGNSHSEDFTPQTSTPSPDVSSSPQPDEALILSYTQDPQPDPSPSSTGISPEPSHNKAGGMNDRESGEEEEEEGREVDGDGEGIEGEGGKRGSGGPSTFLESQESGYHSPSSQPEAPAFEDVARTNAQTV